MCRKTDEQGSPSEGHLELCAMTAEFHTTKDQSGRYGSFRLDPKLLDDRPPFLGIGFHISPSASGVCRS